MSVPNSIPPEDVHSLRLDGRGRVTIPKDVREQWNATSGDRLDVAVVGTDAPGYVCDECNEAYDLPEVLVLEGGERVVCANCSGVEDRIVSDA